MSTPGTKVATAAAKRSLSLAGGFMAHLPLACLGHSTKSVFVLPGNLVAFDATGAFAIGFLACTLIASGNYVLSEVLDATRDRHHPAIGSRPAAAGKVQIPLADAQRLIIMHPGWVAVFWRAPYRRVRGRCHRSTGCR